MAAWTKLLQDLGPYSKSRAWAERGKLFRCEGLPSTQGKPKTLPLHYLGWSQWPFHGIGYILRSLQFKGMCHTLMIPQPLPSVLHRRQLWFSQLIPPFVSAMWILVSSRSHIAVSPTHLHARERGLSLSSSDARQGAGTAKPKDAVLTGVIALSTRTHKESPAVVITAQLKRFGICGNG